jgi:hypothetical protein
MGDNTKPHLSYEEAIRIFEYRDGKLYWRIKPRYQTCIGTEAGYVNKRGYRAVGWNKRLYRAHRIVFLMHYGYMPEQIDHINGNRDDNRIENLREATASQNQWNRGANIKNATGHKNIKWVDRLKKFVVAIAIEKRSKHIGVYADLESALQAASAARSNLHGEFARTV